MSNLNKIMLIGNCAAAPETKTTKNGKTLAKLRVATNRWWRDDDGEHKATEWHDVLAWERLGEQCAERAEKGSKVYVEGRIQTHAWKDDQGNDRSKKEIVAHTVKFFGNGPVAAAA